MTQSPLLFERYQLIERLGRGAYATVYLARDTRMDRLVAVKVVEDTADVDRRALREAKAAAKLDHPHVVTVHEVLREGNLTFLITEYVDGSTVREAYLKRALNDRQILEMGLQAARALEHAHRRGVIHRDIKPENIMLSSGDEIDVRVMDFGVARLEDSGSVTQEGDLVGTLAYMAPEQAQGLEVGPKADVFSLGLVLYEGLTGRNPLRGKSLIELTSGEAHRRIEPLLSARPDLPEEVAEAIEAALAFDERLRVDAAGFRRLLERALRVLPEMSPEVPGRIEKTLVRVRSPEFIVRMRFVGARVLAAAVALAALGHVLPQVPFYPPSSVVYIVGALSFVVLLWPSLGNALALGLLAPCVFAFAPAWGILYVVLVFPSALILWWRGYGWTMLMPLAVLYLGSLAGAKGSGLLLVFVGGVALCAPFLFGLWARFMGPLLSGWSGIVLALGAGFEGWSHLPFVFGRGVDPVLTATRYSRSLWDALIAFARLLDARPELEVQVIVFILFALPVWQLLRGSLSRRLWTASAYLGAMGLSLSLAPPLLVGADTSPWLATAAMIPCVIIVLLVSVFIPPQDRAPQGVGHGFIA